MNQRKFLFFFWQPLVIAPFFCFFSSLSDPRLKIEESLLSRHSSYRKIVDSSASGIIQGVTCPFNLSIAEVVIENHGRHFGLCYFPNQQIFAHRFTQFIGSSKANILVRPYITVTNSMTPLFKVKGSVLIARHKSREQRHASHIKSHILFSFDRLIFSCNKTFLLQQLMILVVPQVQHLSLWSFLC